MGRHVKPEVPVVLLAGACLQVPFRDPPSGVLAERDPAGVRVEPVAAEHLRLGRDEPALGCPLRVERMRRLTRQAVRRRCSGPASGRTASARTVPKRRFDPFDRRLPLAAGTVHESMYSCQHALRDPHMSAEPLELDPTLLDQTAWEPLTVVPSRSATSGIER